MFLFFYSLLRLSRPASCHKPQFCILYLLLLLYFILIPSSEEKEMWNNIYNQLSPCGHPFITDTRYYGQNTALHPAKAIEARKWLPRAIADSPNYVAIRYDKSWLYPCIFFFISLYSSFWLISLVITALLSKQLYLDTVCGAELMKLFMEGG